LACWFVGLLACWFAGLLLGCWFQSEIAHYKTPEESAKYNQIRTCNMITVIVAVWLKRRLAILTITLRLKLVLYTTGLQSLRGERIDMATTSQSSTSLVALRW
jgi:hypothetical protein